LAEQPPAVAGGGDSEQLPGDGDPSGRGGGQDAGGHGGGQDAGGSSGAAIIPRLACILALQALHDGEGDVWQVYSMDMRGWGTRLNSVYGAAVGVANTAGGLLTGQSVRRFGNRMHTLAWTLSTALSNLLFMSRSSALAFASVPFSAAEDCMSAAVSARIARAGAGAGMSQGQLAGDCHNMAACVRVVGLYLFGKLYAVGLRVGMPQMAYVVCAAAQLVAALLTLGLPTAVWDGARAQPVTSRSEPPRCTVFRCRFAPSYFLFLSFFPRDLYPVDSCTVFVGHLRTLEHVMWSVAPTRLDHCLSPMHSESTWFTSVRSLAETDSPGRAQTGTRLAASPGMSDTPTPPRTPSAEQ